MRVIFGRSHAIGSIGIRLFTASRWSHVGIVTKDGQYVIEATFPKGVVKTPIDKFIKRYHKTQLCDFPCKNENYEELALAELGKKYDVTAIFGILFRTHWDKRSAWFCSELVAYASGVYRKDRVGRITPEANWVISTDIK